MQPFGYKKHQFYSETEKLNFSLIIFTFITKTTLIFLLSFTILIFSKLKAKWLKRLNY